MEETKKKKNDSSGPIMPVLRVDTLEPEGAVGQTVDGYQREIRGLKRRLAEATAEIGALRLRQNAATNEICNLGSRIRESKRSQGRLRAYLEERLSAEQRKNAKLEDELKGSSSVQARLCEANERMEKSLQDSMARERKLWHEQSELEKENAVLKESLNASMVAADKLRQKQADSTKEYEALKQANNSLQESLKQALEKLHLLGAENKALKRFVEEVDQERDDVTKLKHQLESSLEGARASADSLKASVARLDTQSDYLSSVFDINPELSRQLATIEEEDASRETLPMGGGMWLDTSNARCISEQTGFGAGNPDESEHDGVQLVVPVSFTTRDAPMGVSSMPLRELQNTVSESPSDEGSFDPREEKRPKVSTNAFLDSSNSPFRPDSYQASPGPPSFGGQWKQREEYPMRATPDKRYAFSSRSVVSVKQDSAIATIHASDEPSELGFGRPQGSTPQPAPRSVSPQRQLQRVRDSSLKRALGSSSTPRSSSPSTRKAHNFSTPRNQSSVAGKDASKAAYIQHRLANSSAGYAPKSSTKDQGGRQQLPSMVEPWAGSYRMSTQRSTSSLCGSASRISALSGDPDFQHPTSSSRRARATSPYRASPSSTSQAPARDSRLQRPTAPVTPSPAQSTSTRYGRKSPYSHGSKKANEWDRRRLEFDTPVRATRKSESPQGPPPRSRRREANPVTVALESICDPPD